MRGQLQPVSDYLSPRLGECAKGDGARPLLCDRSIKFSGKNASSQRQISSAAHRKKRGRCGYRNETRGTPCTLAVARKPR